MYFHGHRSGAAEPILFVFALLAGGTVLLIAVAAVYFAVTGHPSAVTTVAPPIITTVQPVIAPPPVAPEAPPRVCFPLQPC